jgi:phage-related protein
VANQAKMLQGRVQNLAADMGQKLLPAASAVLGGLIGLVSALPQVAGFLKDNATTIGIVAGIITAVLLPALIRWGVQSTISAAKSVAAWVTTQTAAITSSWAQVGAGIRVVAGWVAMGVQSALAAARVVAGWVLMGVQSMIQAARMAAAWFIALGPVGWVIAAVVALAALIIANWDTIKNATVAAWGAVVNWVKSAWEWIKNTVAAGARFAMAVVMAHWNALKAGTSAIWNGIKALISGAWNGIKSLVSGALSGIKSGISAAWSWLKSTTSSAWNSLKTGISTTISGIVTLVRSIPGKIKSALGNVGSMLLSSGKAIIDGLAQGIRNGLGNVTGAVRDVLSKARNLLPFSPAKEGPFSGRGWSLYSGRSITKALADGMVDEASGLRKAALGVARAAVPPVRGVTAPGVTMGPVRGSAAVSGALRPSEMQGVGAGRSTNITMTTYYPIQEKESQAVNRNLQRIAALPLG